MDALPQSMNPSPFFAEPELFNIVARGKAFVRQNLFPASDAGHLLICPVDQTYHSPLSMVGPTPTKSPLLLDQAVLIKDATHVLQRGLPASHRPEGFTIGWNIGAAGGQSIAHAHCHVIGRRIGDTMQPDGTRLPLRGGIAHVLQTYDSFFREDENDEKLEKLRTTNPSRENMYAKLIRSPHPVCDSHALVVPKRAITRFDELTPEEIADMLALAKSWLKDHHGLDVDAAVPDPTKGANIGWNVGAAAGQAYTSSAIMDVIPRTLGDVEKPRGGICLIKPQVDSAYYRGEKSGVSLKPDGTIANGALEEPQRQAFIQEANRLRSIWPRSPGRQMN